MVVQMEEWERGVGEGEVNERSRECKIKMQGEGGENERSRGKKEREMEKKFAYIQKIAYLCTSASNDITQKFSQSSCYALARQHNCDTHKSGLGTTNQNISWRQSCVAP